MAIHLGFNSKRKVVDRLTQYIVREIEKRSSLKMVLECYKFLPYLQVNNDLKSCVSYIFASLFFTSKREHLLNKKKIFYFTSKALFVLKIIKF